MQSPVSGSPESGGGQGGADGLERRLLSSTAFNYGGQFVTLVVWFFLTPFILHEIGTVQFGLWALVSAIFAYGQLFDLGINDAVTKYTAEHRALGDDETASELIATALALYVLIGLAVLVAGLLLAPNIVGVLNVPASEEQTAVALVRITSIWLALELPAGTVFAVLGGLHRFDLISIIGSGAMLALAGSTVLVLKLGGGVLAISAVLIPLTPLVQIPALIAIRRVAPGLRVGLRGARREHVRSVAAFGTSLFGIRLSETIKSKSNELVLGASLSVAAVAPYSLARRLSELPEMLTFQFARVLMPLSSQLHAEGERETLRAIFLSACRITFGTFLAVAIPMAVFAEPLMVAWVGEEFAKDAAVLVILVWAGLAKVASFPGLMMLQGMNRHRPLVIFALSSAALNVGLALAFVHPYGIEGVAYATLIASAAEALAVIPFALYVNELGLPAFAYQSLLPAALAAVPAAVLAFLLREAVGPSSLVAIGLTGALVTIAYSVTYLMLPQSGRERGIIRRLLTRIRSA